MSVSEEAEPQMAIGPESQFLSGIEYQMQERMMEEKELIYQRLREVTKGFRDRLNQKYMKVEINGIATSGDFEDAEEEELVQISNQRQNQDEFEGFNNDQSYIQ